MENDIGAKGCLEYRMLKDLIASKMDELEMHHIADACLPQWPGVYMVLEEAGKHADKHKDNPSKIRELYKKIEGKPLLSLGDMLPFRF